MSNATVETYKAFADFYDLYVGSYSEDLEFYKSNCSSDDIIIEIGCGTGRVLKYFLENNFSIHGVDISDEMLAKATQKLEKYLETGNLKLFNHDFTYMPTEMHYNKILVTFYTFNYVVEKPENFLKNIYKSLHTNETLIIDLFYPKTMANKAIENVWTEQSLQINGKNIKIKDKRNIENLIEHRIQTYKIDDVETTIVTDRRYFSPDEISFLLLKSGFREVEFSTTFESNSFIRNISEQNLKQNFIVKARK